MDAVETSLDSSIAFFSNYILADIFLLLSLGWGEVEPSYNGVKSLP